MVPERLGQVRAAVVLAYAMAGGCLPSHHDVRPSVDEAIQGREATRLTRAHSDANADSGFEEARGDPVVATVNGAVVSRATVANLLMRSHGAGVLDQLICLEAARQIATAKGLSASQQDVEHEHDLALRRLVDPLAPVTTSIHDGAAAEALLDQVLAERNISKEEFLVILRRNAYLRKIVQNEQVFGEDDLRDEYDRAHGRRVQVRHIQLGSSGDVARVQERLAAGDNFADLAGRYNANTASAKRAGLLEPFSETDDGLPEVFRKVAFSLQPGQVSGPVRTGVWEHLIRVEGVLDPTGADFEEVRGELVERLRQRVTDDQMRRLNEKLLSEADIHIPDPALREGFLARHSELRRQADRR